jgi:hypothetical protein
MNTKPQTSTAASTIGPLILDVIGHIPASSERKSRKPAEAARRRAQGAAARAALAAGALALPTGALGWLTLLPEMLGVWRIQRQLVADIAALYGKKAALTPEVMVYCLFEHTAAQGVRDLVVRVGQRVLVRRAPWRTLGSLTRRIGTRLVRRMAGQGLARWLPLVGAVGVGAYAYFDTAHVAATAMELFGREITLEPAARASG